uniref:Uncharacterized protein n=1 Tax=Strombidium rassoulzadegani TaxID=1082188 RepID=A0A7S3CI38_9SPIT|mmetsp:Transcript_10919/g.18251  ORF Transcript_10919/g.18251 Transcript_10919/m.18251 type:complete len:208 (+) Transcript_10919:229-852(+)
MDDHDVTVGVEFGSYMIKVEDKILKLQVWDTAGQESFRSITKIFYRGAHVVMLSYSVISQLSFENLQRWLTEVKAQCSPDVLIFMVGNKCDMEHSREVDLESALQFKKVNGIDYFCETSAKTGRNIERLFTDCASLIYQKYKGKFHLLGQGGGLDSDRINQLDNSYLNNEQGGQPLGSFKQSNGHRAGKNSRKIVRLRGQKKKKCKC